MPQFALKTELYLRALIYFVVTVLLHWRLHPNYTIILYFLGGIIGLHLLEIIELWVSVKPSPFRNLPAYIVVGILTFFALTSSVSPIGKGVVLLLNLRYLELVWSEYKGTGNLSSWLNGTTFSLDPKTHKIILYGATGIFILATVFFVLI